MFYINRQNDGVNYMICQSQMMIFLSQRCIVASIFLNIISYHSAESREGSHFCGLSRWNQILDELSDTGLFNRYGINRKLHIRMNNTLRLEEVNVDQAEAGDYLQHTIGDLQHV